MRWRWSVLALLLCGAGGSSAAAQEAPHEHAHGVADPEEPHAAPYAPLGIPQTREASGTSWLPDASPMYAVHVPAGPWEVMVHGNVFALYVDDDAGGRGGDEFASINWIMGMARGPVAGGELELRGMLSLEPLTVGGCGYPDLLASGEVCDGERIVDEQHPHDLFMEVAAEYAHELSDDVAVGMYGALAGEPALGPPAYPHRISAFPNPISPIAHHWLDATHIAFGVLTGQIYGRHWKLEASIFNGREPDDQRWDFDFGPIDSFAGRLWWLPNDRMAFQISAGELEEAEVHLQPEPERVDVTRVTASGTYHHPLGGPDIWATTLAWGTNIESGEQASNAVLLESNLTLDRNIVFARAELVEKGAEELALEGEATFTVGKLSAGYTRELEPIFDLVPGVGAQALLSILPDDLVPVYGSDTSLGFAAFLRLHPAAM